MPPAVARIDAFQRPEGALDRVPHPLRRPPTDPEFDPHVVQRQPARALEAYGEPQDVGESFVAHAGSFHGGPLFLVVMVGPPPPRG